MSHFPLQPARLGIHVSAELRGAVLLLPSARDILIDESMRRWITGCGLRRLTLIRLSS